MKKKLYQETTVLWLAVIIGLLVIGYLLLPKDMSATVDRMVPRLR